MLWQTLIEIGQVGLEEEDENMKSLRTDGRLAIRNAHLSFNLRLAYIFLF